MRKSSYVDSTREDADNLLMEVFPKQRLIIDWKRDLYDFQNALTESEKEACRKDARATMDMGIRLYGFAFADELNEIRKDLLK